MANRVNEWIKGELASFADLNLENETMFEFAAAFSSILLGLANMNSTPSATSVPLLLAVQPPFGVAIGGQYQTCVINYRIANEIPTTVLAVSPNATGNVRSDLIVAQFVETPVALGLRSVRQPDTTIVSTEVNQLAQALAFQIIPGTGGPDNLGAIPAGWAQVAQIDVPPNGAALTAANASMTLPTFLSILAGLTVSALNNVTGPVTLECPDGSIIITPNVAAGLIQLQAAAAAASLIALNGLQGRVNLESTDSSVSITRDGNNLNLRAEPQTTGVISLNGYVGDLVLAPGAGVAITRANDGPVISATATPYPVGSTIFRRVGVSGSMLGGYSLVLPALPEGTWELYGEATSYLTNYVMWLSISGATSPSSPQNSRATSLTPSWTFAMAIGKTGQSPSLDLTFVNPGGGVFIQDGSMWFMAVRNS